MAGTIQPVSGAVSTDGKTLTIQLGGGTAPYSFVGGVADGSNLAAIAPFSLAGAPYVPHISAATISAAGLITLTLTTPVGAGEVVNMNYRNLYTATGTNAITDAVGGVCANTGTAPNLTNNSTVTLRPINVFADGDKIEMSGWVHGSSSDPTIVGSSDAGFPDDATYSFVTDATEIAMIGYGPNTPVVWIDGAPVASTPFTSGGGWVLRNLTPTPLAAGKHLIQVAGNTHYVIGWRLAGGTSGGSMDAVPRRKAAIGYASGLPTTNLPPASVVDLDPTTIAMFGAYRPAFNGGPTAASLKDSFGIEFAFHGSGVEFMAVIASGWELTVDGTPIPQIIPAGGGGTTTAPYGGLNVMASWPMLEGLPIGDHTLRALALGFNQGSWAYSVIVTNGTALTADTAAGATTIPVGDVSTIAVGHWLRIAAGKRREYRQVTAINGKVLTLNAALTYAHTSGLGVSSFSAPRGTISKYKSSPRTKTLIGIGDSNTQGANEYGFTGLIDPETGLYPASYDVRESAVGLAAYALGIDFVNLAVQGTTADIQATASTTMGGATGYARGQLVDYVTFFPGTNDINGNVWTPAQFTTYCQTVITNSLAVLKPTGKLILMPCLTTVGQVSAKGLSPTVVRGILEGLARDNGPRVACLSGLGLGLFPADYDVVHYKRSGRKKVAAELSRSLSDNHEPIGNGFFAV